MLAGSVLISSSELLFLCKLHLLYQDIRRIHLLKQSSVSYKMHHFLGIHSFVRI